MKCRMMLPVGVLTYLVCFGGVNASAFDRFRLIGEEAAVAEPAPIESEGGKLEVTQKDMDSACQKSPACQKGYEPFALPCRPRLRGWGPSSCEPALRRRAEMRPGQPEGLRSRVPKGSGLPKKLRTVRSALPPAIAGLGTSLRRAGLRRRAEMRPGQPEGLRPRVPKGSRLPKELRTVRAALPPAVAGLGTSLRRAGLRRRAEMRPGQPEGLRPRVPKGSRLPKELRAVRSALPSARQGLGQNGL